MTSSLPQLEWARSFIKSSGGFHHEIVELARYVSPAVFIEPELIRAMRVRMLPALDVGVEPDLWFSQLVRSRSPEGIRFESSIRLVLQEQLAQLWQKETRFDQKKIQRAEQVMQRVHRNMSPALALEERLNWISIRGDEESLEEELGRVLSAALTRANRSGLLRWWSEAWDRLPELVRESPSAWLLKEAAAANIGTRRLTSSRYPKGLHDIDMAAVLVDVDDRKMGVRRKGAILELGELDGEDIAAILVPDTDPIPVDVAFFNNSGEHLKSVAVPMGEVMMLTVGTGPVELRNALGVVYRLDEMDRRDDNVTSGVTEQDKEPSKIWSAALTIGVDSYEEFPPLREAGKAVGSVSGWLTDPQGGNVSKEMTTSLYNPGHQDDVYQSVVEILERANEKSEEPGLFFVFIAGHLYHSGDGNIHLILGQSTYEFMQTVAVSELQTWIAAQSVFREVFFVVCGVVQPTMAKPLDFPLMHNTEQGRESSKKAFIFHRADVKKISFNDFAGQLLQGLDGAAGELNPENDRGEGRITTNSLVSYLRSKVEDPNQFYLEFSGLPDMVLRDGVILPSGKLQIVAEDPDAGEVIVVNGQLQEVWKGEITGMLEIELPNGLYGLHSRGEEQFVEVKGGETRLIHLVKDTSTENGVTEREEIPEREELLNIADILFFEGSIDKEVLEALHMLYAGEKRDVDIERRRIGRAIQRILVFLGYSTRSSGRTAIDGTWRPGVNRGIAQFMVEHDAKGAPSLKELAYSPSFTKVKGIMPDVPPLQEIDFSAAVFRQMIRSLNGRIEAGEITFGDRILAVQNLDAIEKRLLLDTAGIYNKYGALVKDVAGDFGIQPEWVLAVIKQETSGIIQPIFDQRLFSKRVKNITDDTGIRELRLQSTTLGFANIIGMNFLRAGFTSAEEMSKGNPRRQIEAVCHFIDQRKETHRSDPTPADFKNFARFFSGPSTGKNRYDDHLQKWFGEFRTLRRQEPKKG